MTDLRFYIPKDIVTRFLYCCECGSRMKGYTQATNVDSLYSECSVNPFHVKVWANKEEGEEIEVE